MSPISVDFYLLSNEASEDRGLVICRLIETAYLKKHKIYVHCQNQHDAELLDDLLWSFKDDSFIPHNLLGEGPEPPPPVQIGYNREPRGFNDILINMAHDIPPFHHKFKRIIEVVPDSESEKEICRVHYREYKARKYQLQTHNVTSETESK